MKVLNTFIAILFSLTTLSVTAGESEVTWTDPDKYTDIRPSNESKSRFQKRIFKSFEEHFAKLSEQLPEGQKLKIDVTNVDLAGDVRLGSTQQIRIVKDIYIPRIKFTFELVNADNTIESSGDVDLKDMSFMMSPNAYSSGKSLNYEKRMLDKWFNDTFIKKEE